MIVRYYRSVSRHFTSSVSRCWRSDGCRSLLCSKLLDGRDRRHRCRSVQRSGRGESRQFKTFAATSASFWGLGGISPFSPAPMESCSSMPKSSPPVQTSGERPLQASTPIPSSAWINTYWHFDHTGGNGLRCHKTEDHILAHENTRKRLSQATRVEGNFRYTFLAAPAGAIPCHRLQRRTRCTVRQTLLSC